MDDPDDTPGDLYGLKKMGTGVYHDRMAAFNVMLLGIATVKGIDVRPETVPRQDGQETDEAAIAARSVPLNQ